MNSNINKAYLNTGKKKSAAIETDFTSKTTEFTCHFYQYHDNQNMFIGVITCAICSWGMTRKVCCAWQIIPATLQKCAINFIILCEDNDNPVTVVVCAFFSQK